MRYISMVAAIGAFCAFAASGAAAPIVINETDKTDYEFGNQVQAGVVVLCEYGTKVVDTKTICKENPKDDSAIRISDVVNFFNLGGKGQASMNSDSEDTDKPAVRVDDTAVMNAVLQKAIDNNLPIVFMAESDPKYTATAGLPGYDTTNGKNVEYSLVSDADVPEPATWGILGLGLAVLLGLRWCRPALD